jgi:hypothetical protein
MGVCPVPSVSVRMTLEELQRRLERADRQRLLLRRATLELRAMGQSVLRARRDGLDRPDRRRTRYR